MSRPLAGRAVELVVARLEDRGVAVKRTYKGHLAECPAHNDGTPSLSIDPRTVGDSGAVLLCRAGCPTENVLAELGLEMRDLFDDPDEWDRQHKREPTGRGSVPALTQRSARQSPPQVADPLPTESELDELHRRLLSRAAVLERLLAVRGWSRATIEHFRLGFDGERVVIPVRGADGSLLTVLRYKPGAAERKMLALKGRARDLFPAPEAVEGEPLWVVEGEADAISAHELGLAAVAIPGVAYANRAAEWAHRLADRRLIAMFDCDEEGRRAVNIVGEALLPHAAEVKVIDREGNRSDGHDLTDLLLEGIAANNGNGRREVRRALATMAAAAPPLVPSEVPGLRDGKGADGSRFLSSPRGLGRDERERGLPFAPLSEVVAQAPDEPEWVLEGYLAPGSTTLFAGRPKVGKSTAAFALFRAMLRGDPFFGRATRCTGILLLTEEGRGSLKEKVRRFGVDGRVDVLLRSQARGVCWPEVVAQAVERCRERALGVLVVDTWDKWTGLRGDAENSAGATLEALEPLVDAAASGLAVLILTHQRKAPGKFGEAVRGSSALAGGVDVVMELEHPAGAEGTTSTARVLRAVSRFESTPEELTATLEGDCYLACGGVGMLRAADEIARLLEALRAYADGATADELAEATGIKKGIAHKRLEAFVAEGTVQRTGAGVRGDPYRFLSSRPHRLGDESNRDTLGEDGGGPPKGPRPEGATAWTEDVDGWRLLSTVPTEPWATEAAGPFLARGLEVFPSSRVEPLRAAS
jgi:hypothetical protein